MTWSGRVAPLAGGDRRRRYGEAIENRSNAPSTGPIGQRRTIEVDGAFNFRDLGGIDAVDGRPLATGRLYRSAALDALTDRGLATVQRLGIRTVIDLRSAHEVEHHGRFPYERVPVQWIHLPAGMGPPSDPDDGRARAILDHPDPLGQVIRSMVTDQREDVAQALRLLAQPTTPPVVFHCTSGKDRTGVLAALVQLIAGAGLDDVLADFEYSARAVEAAGHDLVGRYPIMSALPPDQVARFHAADPAWLLDAIEAVGGLDGLQPWLDSIGVDRSTRAGLRSHFGLV